MAPVSPELTALTGRTIAVSGRPNALRDEVRDVFEGRGGTWEIRVPLCTDLATMLVEDASVAWPETESPYVAVARIAVKPQVAWSEARSAVGDDQMAFDPWHCTVDHRPLGGIMRSRRDAYAELSGLRGRINGCPLHEPAGVVVLPN